MIIDLHLDHSLSPDRMENLYTFLIHSGIAPQGATICFTGPMADQELPQHPAFAKTVDQRSPSLEIAFLNNKVGHNASLLKNSHLPKLLVSRRGLPAKVKRVIVPFEKKRFGSRWLRPVLEHAVKLGWPVELLYCDTSWVSKEIVKLADWFRIDIIKDHLAEWITQDMIAQLKDLIEDYPEVKVHAEVGKLGKKLMEQGMQRPLIMGSLRSGYHIPHHHHGLNYGKLLTAADCSGLFLPE